MSRLYGVNTNFLLIDFSFKKKSGVAAAMSDNKKSNQKYSPPHPNDHTDQKAQF